EVSLNDVGCSSRKLGNAGTGIIGDDIASGRKGRTDCAVVHVSTGTVNPDSKISVSEADGSIRIGSDQVALDLHESGAKLQLNSVVSASGNHVSRACYRSSDLGTGIIHENARITSCLCACRVDANPVSLNLRIGHENVKDRYVRGTNHHVPGGGDRTSDGS